MRSTACEEPRGAAGCHPEPRRGRGTRTLQAGLVFLAAILNQLPLLAQTNDQTMVIVPVVGNTLGANGVVWKTDLELHNDQPNEVIVAIELANPPNFVSQTLAPGETLRMQDVVGQSFGVEGSPSPLIIRTSGRRSILIRAIAYGVRGGEVFPPHEIAVQYRPVFFPTRVLHNLAFSDDYRTNIGLANLGTRSADFILALQRLNGRNLAVTRVSIPANSLWHFSVQSAFPLITKGENFSVLIETSSPDTYVYGSVVENATNAGRFIEPNLAGSLAAQR